jgi:hypothetical protein
MLGENQPILIVCKGNVFGVLDLLINFLKTWQVKVHRVLTSVG